jgi:hypothetical protein
MPVSMMPTFTPWPDRPSWFCAMSAPVSPSAVAMSGAVLALGLICGAGMISTGYSAFTPGRRASLARSAGLTSTEKPLNSVSKLRRSV